MSRSPSTALLGAGLVGLLLALGHTATASQLAVGWTDPATGTGVVRAMSTKAPWRFVGRAIETGPAPALHASAGLLFASSASAGTVTVIDAQRWRVLNVVDLGAGNEPEDVLAVRTSRAYITLRNAAELLRLNPCTGELSQAIDFAPLADDDGIPDLGTMAHFGNRLYVEVRRLNGEAEEAFARPAQIGVVDLRTERLIDVDRATEGIQGIALAGTPPKTQMQLVTATNGLAVGASGGFFDQGGIEVVDIARRESRGPVVREADGEVGADLGAFIFTRRDGGYLTYSTDLLLSSHLHRFDISGAVDPVELDVSVDYFAPALAHDRSRNLLFVPHGGFETAGIHVFNARNAVRLTQVPVATPASPSDLTLISPSRAGASCRRR